MKENVRDDVVYNKPKSFAERRAVATHCCSRMSLEMPCVVDDMENSGDALYAGWPERMFIIGADGKIAYAGEQGPWGFNPNEVELWLRKHLGQPHRCNLLKAGIKNPP